MAAIYTPPSDQRAFKFGLFDCLGDINTCLFAFLLPCLLVKSNAEAMAEHPLFMCCCVQYPLATWLLRQKLRLSHNIQGDLLDDCWQVTIFSPCALVQLTREIKDIQGSK